MRSLRLDLIAPVGRRAGKQRRAWTATLSACLSLGTLVDTASAQIRPTPAKVQANGGVMVQSQGEGSPNTVTGYLFAPLSQGAAGEVLFLDVAANLNLGGALTQQNNVSAGASTRLGYRWLSSDQRWMYGFNAGVDTRQAYAQYAFQAGVGAEALSRGVELRANGYIPFSNQADQYQSGWSNGVLNNNQLIVDGWNRYVVSLGGINLEAGLPISRWSQGKDSLWLYASYYYLSGDYVTGSSGVRGRAELRMGSQLSLGATLSYDDIFQLQATGYIRYGAKPLSAQTSDAITVAEREFLALRGLPMQRDVDMRMVAAQQNLPGALAMSPSSGNALVVRCTGTTSATISGQASCAYPNASTMLAAAGSGDALLLGGGASVDLSSQPADAQGRPTLRLAAGTALGGSSNAPTVMTQFGPANLNTVFGTTVGSQPAIRNGVISIGSNTTISGLSFTNTSITNHSTSNVLIQGNTFLGSYSPTPGSNTYNQNALPTIAFGGVSNTTITQNSFDTPNVQSYLSATGNKTDDKTSPIVPICTSGTNGICLSGNAIRVGPSASGVTSSGLTISNNTITAALDEAIRLDNVSGSIRVSGNTITGTRNGPDSNMQAAIFIRQWSGKSSINVTSNSITANQAGVNDIAAGSKVSSGTFSRAGGTTQNIVDPLEIGLCRGNQTFSNRKGDKYADDFGGFNCRKAAPASMNYTASGNTLKPSQNATNFDEDGIDFNVGSYGSFTANVTGNNILIKSDKNNALTTDFRGDNHIDVTVSGNTLTSTNYPISIQGGTLNGLTSYVGSGGPVKIGSNQLTNTKNNNPANNPGIQLDSVARNPTSAYPSQPPVTPVFNVTVVPALSQPGNIVFEESNFNVTGNNDYPKFILNNKPLN